MLTRRLHFIILQVSQRQLSRNQFKAGSFLLSFLSLRFQERQLISWLWSTLQRLSLSLIFQIMSLMLCLQYSMKIWTVNWVTESLWRWWRIVCCEAWRSRKILDSLSLCIQSWSAPRRPSRCYSTLSKLKILWILHPLVLTQNIL